MDVADHPTRIRKRKRVSRKPTSCPNPLFEKWLTQLKEEAAKKDATSRIVHVYAKALKSLQKYPLLLHSGQECKVLKNFGPGLCKIIDEKLERHLSGHGDRPAFTSTCSGSQMIELEAQTVPVAASCSRAATAAPCGPASPTKTTKTTTAGKSSKSKEYVPGRRTAAYAVLLTLHRNLAAGFLTKKDLQEAAQPLSDASLTRSVPNSRYTGWSCVSQLIDKGLIVKSGCPARFQLTESGKVLAQRLDQVEAEFQEPQPTISNGPQVELVVEPVHSDPWRAPTIDAVPLDDVDEEDGATCAPGPHITLRPDQYDIVLCVDTAEVTGGTGANSQKEAAARAFQKCGVAYEVRKLAIGDYVWICKPRPGVVAAAAAADAPLVLPFIVERKRLDDLASSIKDGRFKEQKFRLKHCGLSRPVYLIEEHGSRQNLGLPEANLMQAVANTLVIDGFQCHWTHSSSDSVAFLSLLTKQMAALYQGRTVHSRTYNDPRPTTDAEELTRLLTLKDLNAASWKQKPLSVTDMLAKQLMQLSGLTVDKAEAIVNVYPTPAALLAAFRAAGGNSKEADQLLARVEFGRSKRAVGVTISTTLAKLYTQNRFDS